LLKSGVDAQQAAEKAIKAVFVLHGKRFPLTHDLFMRALSLAQGVVEFADEHFVKQKS
jgi:HEPN domain-containing protein